jgi:hypothetical protein
MKVVFSAYAKQELDDVVRYLTRRSTGRAKKRRAGELDLLGVIQNEQLPNRHSCYIACGRINHSVSVYPGATEFTRIPRELISFESPLL